MKAIIYQRIALEIINIILQDADNVEVLLRCARAYRSRANLAKDAEGRLEAVNKGVCLKICQTVLDENYVTVYFSV